MICQSFFGNIFQKIHSLEEVLKNSGPDPTRSPFSKASQAPRRDDSSVLMLPAHQCLCTDEPQIIQSHLGLKINLEVPVLQRVLHTVYDFIIPVAAEAGNQIAFPAGLWCRAPVLFQGIISRLMP